jgi:mono/diheme cytochrome c family protein
MKLIVMIVAVMIIALVISASAFAQDAAKTPPTVKHVPITRVPADSGKDMFATYCAVCHGATAKGDGPAASALKTPPPDLTVLSKKNGGKYPSAHVAAVIRGQDTLVSHGTAEMPMWGPLFSSISGGHTSQVEQRISNLAQYIGTLQVK